MMNNMTDANNQAGSDETGSPAPGPESNNTPTGQPGEEQKGQVITQEMYDALEQKLGEQGNELGGFREFFESISPLLEQLDTNPDLVQAIVDGKVSQDLGKAVLEGKVTIGDAEVVTTAAKAVAKEQGKTAMEQMTPEKVEKLIEQKVSQTRSEMEEQAALKDFEATTEAFITNTPDFADYADEIDKWLDNHNVSDIEVAYYAVKGQMTTKEAKDAAEEAESQRAKELAMNASGGGVSNQTTADGRPIIDDLVAGPANPLFH